MSDRVIVWNVFSAELVMTDRVIRRTILLTLFKKLCIGFTLLFPSKLFGLLFLGHLCKGFVIGGLAMLVKQLLANKALFAEFAIKLACSSYKELMRLFPALAFTNAGHELLFFFGRRRDF